MNRREFLRRAGMAALMATPAMQAAAFLRDFGDPTGRRWVEFKADTWNVAASGWLRIAIESEGRAAGSLTMEVIPLRDIYFCERTDE